MDNNMTDSYNENKWSQFEISGKVSDYLEYKGVNSKNFSNANRQERIEYANGIRAGCI